MKGRSKKARGAVKVAEIGMSTITRYGMISIYHVPFLSFEFFKIWQIMSKRLFCTIDGSKIIEHSRDPYLETLSIRVAYYGSLTNRSQDSDTTESLFNTLLTCYC